MHTDTGSKELWEMCFSLAHMSPNVCVLCVCVHMCLYMCMCVYVCVYENVYVCESVCMYAHSCVKVQVHTCHDVCVAVRGTAFGSVLTSAPTWRRALFSLCTPRPAGCELLHFPVSTSRPLVGSMLGFLMLAPRHLTFTRVFRM